MQRYRVNYPLLIGLVVGFFVFAVGGYFLWRFQVDRNAKYLVAKAEAAEAEGRLKDAFDSLFQYVRLKRDDYDQWVHLGEVSADLSEQPDLDSEVMRDAYQGLFTAVRETDSLAIDLQKTSDPGLRRKLVDLQVRYGMFTMAHVNIEQLLKNGSKDPELMTMEAQCLFAMQRPVEGAGKCYKLIGYDPKAKEFDSSKAAAPNKPIAYAMLAQYERAKAPELSDQILEKMIEANPDSREAYMLYYHSKKSVAAKEGRTSEAGQAANEAAIDALAKAYELDPTDATVLSAKGSEEILKFQVEMQAAQGPDGVEQREAAKAHLDAAAKYFAEALERYPDRVDFYERVAKVDMMREDTDKALQVLEQGIKRFPLRSKTDAVGLPLAIILSNLKVEIFISQKKFDAVADEIKLLRQVNNSQVKALADFHEARIDAINEKWAQAARTLQRVKPLMLNFPEQQAVAGAVQGFCHTQLGQLDLALQAYDWALQKNPDMMQAKVGAAEIRAKFNPDDQPEDGAPQIDDRIREMMARPKAEQDWPAVFAEIDAYIDQQAAMRPVSNEWVASRKALLRGQTQMMRGMEAADETEKKLLFQEARNHIRDAFKVDKSDPIIQMTAIRLLAQEPGSGPAVALKQLDNVVSSGKDSAQYRALRIELLAALRDEKLPEQLNAATEGMDQWPATQQAMVWSAAAAQFERIGRYDDARRALEKSAELAPQSLPAQMALFDLALRQNNDAAMREAQEGVLAIVKSQTAPDYVLTEVKRRIAGQETGASTSEELKEARDMLEAALKIRPTWSELHVANAQLYMLLDNNPDKALAALRDAVDQGGASLNAVVVHVRLLAERGRLREAREAMNRIPQQAWSTVLGQGAANILIRTGEVDRAFAEAEKIVGAKPEDAPTQLWFAEIAIQTNKLEAAEGALKKALELNPGEPDLWTRMVSLYMQMKRPDDIERTLREAHLALDAEYLPLLTAKYYELQSRWQEAEDIYLAALGSREDDLSVARRMAEFYLLWESKDPANRAKAARYINRLLKASYEGRLDKDDPNVPWARRQAARLLAASGDYRDSLKAERLLSSAVESGAATPEDQAQLIDILSLRRDPVSRQRAVDLLRSVKKNYGALTPEREIQLGHALFELGDWQAARNQMTAAIEQFPDHLGLKTAFISMMISQKEFDEAQRWIARLDGVKDAAAPQAELRLRLAAARDKKSEVRQILTSMTPNLRLVTPEQLQAVKQVALLADSLGDHEYALDMMRQYVSRANDGRFELARLTAMYGDVDEGLTLLRQQTSNHLDDVMTIAIEVLRKRRNEAPEKLDAEVERIIRQGLRDDPDSAKRMMNEAEMFDVQEKYEQSVAAYKKLLARDDVPNAMRAAAANNMAFIVALQNPDAENLKASLEAVNEAVELLGPLSDVLDTRALVYMAQQQYDQAAQDMQMAVKMNATPMKYFHLAQSLMGAGDERGARQAWDRAKSEGLKVEEAPKLERPHLEEFSRIMEGVPAQANL